MELIGDDGDLITLRTCMIKKEFVEEDYRFFLSDSAEVKSYNLDEKLNFEAKIWVKTPELKRPIWAKFLDELTEEFIDELKSMSSSAAIFVKVPEKGIIIFLFGYGRHLINQAYIQRDFGIKTALNCLDHKTLRSIDSLTLDDQAVQKRTQASRDSNINTFGIDVSKDILRSVTGLPKKGVPYNSISGGDAYFGFSKKIKKNELFDTAREIIEFYNKDDYKDNFEWIDNIKRIKKDEIVENLNGKLIAKIKSKDINNIHLNVPEILSWDQIDGFSFTRNKSNISPTLEIENYYNSFDSSEYKEERFKQDRVFIFDSQNNEEKIPIYKCIYSELIIDGIIYVYYNAEWFEIDKDFVANIDKSILSIDISNITFPEVLKSNSLIEGESICFIESEKDYNLRASIELSCHNLDAKLIRSKMVSTPIEICDLLMQDKKLIHVKHRKGGSAGLSHLFSQGFVSAETILSDRAFRISARKVLKKVGADLELIPLDKFKSENYEIVYLVLGFKDDIRKTLPFFSKINLYRTYKELTQRGFKVSLAGAGFTISN
ncbi:DUF6119 family protein [Anditalea andensis]|uniref:Sporadically distributed protein, TIGR04141 family n=1 Tax=Anditalea andensis TaxID=1048983 RepID=A0A074LD18_9BACT|nr:DUF6119 family protein [Anditalea andensis]KEO71662.1 hypothetical protein EL17_23420 [Anditalea andensis]